MPTPQADGPDHYFTGVPGAPSSPSSLELALPEGRLLTLRTDRGVFSGDRVDPGTKALLSDGPAVVEGGVLVDVGCGYGPIAVALALRGGEACQVWAVDVNERARDLCRVNAEANGVGDRVRVVAPADVPADLQVDQVWSNPPIRIGKVALHELLARWLAALRPGTGEAALVVHKHLGAESLERWLRGQGHPTERLASRAGYRILRVQAGTAAGSGAGPAGGDARHEVERADRGIEHGDADGVDGGGP